MKIKKNNIYVFKLVSGEEVITKVTNYKSNSLISDIETSFEELQFITFYRPRVMMPQMVRDAAGNQGMQLGLINLFNGNPDSDEVLINTTAIIGVTEPFHLAVDYYEQSITEIDLSASKIKL
jgi:hypothetical protein